MTFKEFCSSGKPEFAHTNSQLTLGRDLRHLSRSASLLPRPFSPLWRSLDLNNPPSKKYLSIVFTLLCVFVCLCVRVFVFVCLCVRVILPPSSPCLVIVVIVIVVIVIVVIIIIIIVILRSGLVVPTGL